MIQAILSVYPLGQPDFRAVDAALEAIAATGIAFETRAMHTELSGSPGEVFAALRAAYDAAAALGGVILSTTISNSCPLPGRS